jgi:hypothetical protein
LPAIPAILLRSLVGLWLNDSVEMPPPERSAKPSPILITIREKLIPYAIISVLTFVELCELTYNDWRDDVKGKENANIAGNIQTQNNNA